MLVEYYKIGVYMEGLNHMRRICISVFILIALIATVSGCSRKQDAVFSIFYGETEKWLVIGTSDNVFKFIYKGNAEDLKKDSDNGEIYFYYGTSLGSTGSAQLLNDTNYYQVKFEEDFIKGLPDTAFNGDKIVNVQIRYGDTIESIDLSAYTEYKAD